MYCRAVLGAHHWPVTANGEPPWDARGLLTLDTRMESWHQRRDRGGRPRVGTPPDEKAQAVRLVRQRRAELGTEHRTIGRVARQLGYGVESVRAWVNQADVDEGRRAGTTSEDATRIRELEQENREPKRANEILRRVCVFRPGGARPPTSLIVDFVDENKGEPICSALQMAPSTVLRREVAPSARARRDAVMMPHSHYGDIPPAEFEAAIYAGSQTDQEMVGIQ